MSAWIVSSDHIDALVQSAMERGVSWRVVGDKWVKATPDNASEVGRMLWRENHRSVNYRYNQRTRTPHYDYRPSKHVLSPGFVMAQVACYEYQTCEHPAWYGSQAYRLTTALTRSLARELPGYDDAPWGVE